MTLDPLFPLRQTLIIPLLKAGKQGPKEEEQMNGITNFQQKAPEQKDKSF